MNKSSMDGDFLPTFPQGNNGLNSKYQQISSNSTQSVLPVEVSAKLFDLQEGVIPRPLSDYIVQPALISDNSNYLSAMVEPWQLMSQYSSGYLLANSLQGDSASPYGFHVNYNAGDDPQPASLDSLWQNQLNELLSQQNDILYGLLAAIEQQKQMLIVIAMNAELQPSYGLMQQLMPPAFYPQSCHIPSLVNMQIPFNSGQQVITNSMAAMTGSMMSDESVFTSIAMGQHSEMTEQGFYAVPEPPQASMCVSNPAYAQWSEQMQEWREAFNSGNPVNAEEFYQQAKMPTIISPAESILPSVEYVANKDTKKQTKKLLQLKEHSDELRVFKVELINTQIELKEKLSNISKLERETVELRERIMTTTFSDAVLEDLSSIIHRSQNMLEGEFQSIKVLQSDSEYYQNKIKEYGEKCKEDCQSLSSMGNPIDSSVLVAMTSVGQMHDDENVQHALNPENVENRVHQVNFELQILQEALKNKTIIPEKVEDSRINLQLGALDRVSSEIDSVQPNRYEKSSSIDGLRNRVAVSIDKLNAISLSHAGNLGKVERELKNLLTDYHHYNDINEINQKIKKDLDIIGDGNQFELDLCESNLICQKSMINTFIKLRDKELNICDKLTKQIKVMSNAFSIGDFSEKDIQEKLDKVNLIIEEDDGSCEIPEINIDLSCFENATLLLSEESENKGMKYNSDDIKNIQNKCDALLGHLKERVNRCDMSIKRIDNAVISLIEERKYCKNVHSENKKIIKRLVDGGGFKVDDDFMLIESEIKELDGMISKLEEVKVIFVGEKNSLEIMSGFISKIPVNVHDDYSDKISKFEDDLYCNHRLVDVPNIIDNNDLRVRVASFNIKLKKNLSQVKEHNELIDETKDYMRRLDNSYQSHNQKIVIHDKKLHVLSGEYNDLKDIHEKNKEMRSLLNIKDDNVDFSLDSCNDKLKYIHSSIKKLEGYRRAELRYCECLSERKDNIRHATSVGGWSEEAIAGELDGESQLLAMEPRYRESQINDVSAEFMKINKLLVAEIKKKNDIQAKVTADKKSEILKVNRLNKLLKSYDIKISDLLSDRQLQDFECCVLDYVNVVQGDSYGSLRDCEFDIEMMPFVVEVISLIALSEKYCKEDVGDVIKTIFPMIYSQLEINKDLSGICKEVTAQKESVLKHTNKSKDIDDEYEYGDSIVKVTSGLQEQLEYSTKYFKNKSKGIVDDDEFPELSRGAYNRFSKDPKIRGKLEKKISDLFQAIGDAPKEYKISAICNYINEKTNHEILHSQSRYNDLGFTSDNWSGAARLERNKVRDIVKERYGPKDSTPSLMERLKRKGKHGVGQPLSFFGNCDHFTEVGLDTLRSLDDSYAEEYDFGELSILRGDVYKQFDGGGHSCIYLRSKDKIMVIDPWGNIYFNLKDFEIFFNKYVEGKHVFALKSANVRYKGETSVGEGKAERYYCFEKFRNNVELFYKGESDVDGGVPNA